MYVGSRIHFGPYYLSWVPNSYIQQPVVIYTLPSHGKIKAILSLSTSTQYSTTHHFQSGIIKPLKSSWSSVGQHTYFYFLRLTLLEENHGFWRIIICSVWTLLSRCLWVFPVGVVSSLADRHWVTEFLAWYDSSGNHEAICIWCPWGFY